MFNNKEEISFKEKLSHLNCVRDLLFGEVLMRFGES